MRTLWVNLVLNCVESDSGVICYLVVPSVCFTPLVGVSESVNEYKVSILPLAVLHLSAHLKCVVNVD